MLEVYYVYNKNNKNLITFTVAVPMYFYVFLLFQRQIQGRIHC